jgi:hypothetical protein
MDLTRVRSNDRATDSLVLVGRSGVRDAPARAVDQCSTLHGQGT